jgi:hypothetical protein
VAPGAQDARRGERRSEGVGADRSYRTGRVYEGGAASELAGSASGQRLIPQTSTGCTRDALDTALAALSNEQTQRVFWAGYDTARIISISHSRAWMALTRPYVLSPHGALDRQAGRVMCIPRRWMTIYGGVMEQEWRRARTCAAGHILGRPGIMEVS